MEKNREPTSNDTSTWIFIIIIAILVWRLIPSYDNPRDKKGIDFMYSEDSIYHIHFTIDSVEVKEYEPSE